MISAIPKAVWMKRVQLLFSLFTHQGLLQLLNLLNGFFLLRWLPPVPDQAQFSLAFGVQSSMGVLTDLGFTSAIIALSGTLYQQKEKVGSYIRTAQYFRNRLFWIAVFVFGLITPFLLQKHAVSFTTSLSLLLPVVVSVFLMGNSIFFQVPLQLNRSIDAIFRPQIMLSAARLLLTYLLFKQGWLSAQWVLWLIAVTYLVQGRLYKKASQQWVILPAQPGRQEINEMMTYLWPLIPAMIFNAFQGQITIFLIALLGKSQQSIAEVGALSRLNQVYVLLGATNTVLIAPFIARAASDALFRKYLTVMAGTAAAMFVLVSFSFLVPDPFLWLLGSSYSHLREEVGWLMLSGALGFIGNVLMTVHSSRKWIFWRTTWAYISGLILIQLIAILYMDLSVTRGVLQLSCICNAYIILLHLFVARRGFKLPAAVV